MGSILTCFACSALTCCVGATCSCCGASMTCKKSHSTRAAYLMLFVFTAVVTFILMEYGGTWLQQIQSFTDSQECSDSDKACYATLLVFRTTFALFLFHFILAIAMIGVKSSSDGRIGLDNGWWPLKLLIWSILTVLAFFIPSTFFTYFVWVEKIGGAIFILIQLILLIDWAYEWSESWVDQAEKDEVESGSKTYFYLLVSASGVMYGLAIALTVVMYVYFTQGEACGTNIAFITISLFVSIFFTFLAITPKIQEANPKSGLLQASVVTIYSLYLVFSAIQSEPISMGCNALMTSTSSSGKTASLIIGAIFAIISIGYSTLYVSGGYDSMNLKAEGQPLVAEEDGEVQDDEEEQVSYNHSYFHLAFALGACYIAMLYTNWANLDISTNTTGVVELGVGMASVWIKIVSGWLNMIIYIWTVIAPYCLPDREF